MKPKSPALQPSEMDLLDSETIARAEALGLNARYVVEGYMAGEHRSPYHGFAVEFAQHREYTPGDDTRHLDWKVLAKTERHYIKQYEQETNYVAHLLVDGSESMKYGSGDVTKLDYAKQIAACLAYLILTRRDSVSLAIFDEEIQEYTPRSDNRKNLFKIVSKLAAFDANKETRTADVLHHVAHQLKRRGIIVLISDFFDDDDEVLEGIQHLRFGGHEVIAFQVLDPHEIEFPFGGLVEFEGLENIPKLMTRPSQIRETYLREFESFRERLRISFGRNDSHFVSINTNEPLHEILSRYLGFRKAASNW